MNAKIINFSVGLVLAYILSIILSLLNFSEGEYEFFHLQRVSLNILSGPLGGAFFAFNSMDYYFMFFWVVIVFLVFFCFLKYFRSGNFKYLTVGFCTWIFIGLFRVTAASF